MIAALEPFGQLALMLVALIIVLMIAAVAISLIMGRNDGEKEMKRVEWLKTLKKGDNIRYGGTAFKITRVYRKDGYPTKICVRSEAIISKEYFIGLTQYE